jgi:hypothetical protein
MRVNLFQLIKSYGTRTNPTAQTKSIGLPADAALALSVSEGVPCFCSSPRLFHRDPKLTTPTRTWYRLDSFIVHPDSSAIYQDWQRGTATLRYRSRQAPTATNYCSAALTIRRAVSGHMNIPLEYLLHYSYHFLDNFPLTEMTFFYKKYVPNSSNQF